ncbi:unnamed protein product [Knipowitschia caucasica]|uniref:protein-tyrosine-phosphatase n=1 Tax=Knipowitschia caucasica TaxID=637954 RepID=A0AAV2LAE8_KNICA
MDLFTFRVRTGALLWVLCLWPLWRTASLTDAQPNSKAEAENVSIVAVTETTVTISFEKVPGVDDYNLFYGEGNGTDFRWINAGPVGYTQGDLKPATNYHMILRLKVGNETRPGFAFNVTTAPENVAEFKATDQTESSITLQWTKIPDIHIYILKFDGNETTFGEEHAGIHEVKNLSSRTLYDFTLYSVFEDKRSSGFNLTAATAPAKAKGFKAVTQNETSVTLQWTNDDLEINYSLRFNGVTKKNFTAGDLGNPAQYTVTGLQSTTLYDFTLVTVFRNISGAGESLRAATAPLDTDGFGPVHQNDTSITLQWEPVPGVVEYLLRFNGANLTIKETNATTVSDLKSGTWFNFTLFSVFHRLLSRGVSVSAATAPRDANGFKAQTQTEISVTLQWERVGDIQDYVIEYDTRREAVNASAGAVVTHLVSSLLSGKLYNFTLTTHFANLSSRGVRVEAPTVPPSVSSVEASERTLTSITLRWKSEGAGWTYRVDSNGSAHGTLSQNADVVSYAATSLKPGSLYSFSIVTEFKTLNSSAFGYDTATVIDCGAVDWEVTDSSIRGVVQGVFTDASASNGSQRHQNSGSSGKVLFMGLYPGAQYDLKLVYKELDQCDISLFIIPPRLTAKCKNWNAGYSIYIEWDSPSGVWDLVEVNVSGVSERVEHMQRFVEINNFQPAKKYQVSVSSVSGPRRSSPYVFTCATDARGVIAGAFFGVLLFIVLVCAIIFIKLRKPGIIRKQKKSVNGGIQTSVRKDRWIPLDRFPAHFSKLSADENKGFSLEYEDLGIVGTDQSQKAATTNENKPKNRFINVLPYDQSRVKLTSSSSHNDYINASYMPGYSSSREFIAAQGPLSSTVNDFWRMIWEQKVRRIVMVTNCTEGGRTKCEQYWPLGPSRTCADLEVLTTSEQKEPEWTLREFNVKHRHTSEERTVKHFHFTAWPDHGVPQGTQVLIQFRELVRHHMQTEAAGTPTVVHCSAGVGRTGTIIALDVLLQQMDKDKAVDVNGFVHKMRLHRPHMVQTESQYVFLHQCVLDSLQLNEKEENIYENELIYANATALQDFHT